MRNKRVYCAILVLLMTASALAAAPYATITYAEGKSFSLLRSGKQTTVSVSSPDVFGMEIVPGDVIQTGAGTFLELYINPIAASVQIAENTSFRCDADSTGAKSSGELYYGRVRAKVAKLSGSSSYRISSPSLVAGVRGTDFGCDVIAVRPTRTSVRTLVRHFFESHQNLRGRRGKRRDADPAPGVLLRGQRPRRGSGFRRGGRDRGRRRKRRNCGRFPENRTDRRE